jgi:ParB-like chromosome segregation protein Spo0J
MKTRVVKIGEVKANPDNPRLIKDDKFKKLVASIQSFPQMLEIRPIVVNDQMIVLGGNMRLKACKEAGLKTVTIIDASDLTEEQQREFVIKDNVGFGEWDWNDLANNWDPEQLMDWGLDIPGFQISKQQIGVDQDVYDFENFDNTGMTTIRIVLPDEKAKELIDKVEMLKGTKNTSEFFYEHFCN